MAHNTCPYLLYLVVGDEERGKLLAGCEPILRAAHTIKVARSSNRAAVGITKQTSVQGRDGVVGNPQLPQSAANLFEARDLFDHLSWQKLQALLAAT